MPTRLFGRLAAVSAFLLLVVRSSAASADAPPTDAQIAAARDLFLAAERDEDAQRWAEALEKLQRVSVVKLTSGIRYHMALCEEHLGHLVAALRDYKAAANQARGSGCRARRRMPPATIFGSVSTPPIMSVVSCTAISRSVSGAPSTVAKAAAWSTTA